jgi:hypothetical protein
MTTVDGDLGGMPMRCRDRRRKFTVAERIEIGQRDSWRCGICQDPTRLVEWPLVMLVKEIGIEELIVVDVSVRGGMVRAA